jgi:hypothetical protein
VTLSVVPCVRVLQGRSLMAAGQTMGDAMAGMTGELREATAGRGSGGDGGGAAPALAGPTKG